MQDPLLRSYALKYDAASNRSALTLPNTTSTSYGYDVNNRTTSVATMQAPAGGGSPLTVASFAYTLDAEGKRTRFATAPEASFPYRAWAHLGSVHILSSCRREVAQRPGPSSPDGCPVVVVEEVEPLGVNGEDGT